MAKKDQEKPIRTESQIRHASEADEEAKRLVDILRPMHRPEAEKYVSENPPSVAVIVGMAFYENHLASKQPRPNVLSSEIAEILEAKPNASTDEVIDALRERAGAVAEITDVHDDGTVVWVDRGTLKDTKKSDIAKRVSRARNAKKK